jgi:hypothetical protein
MKNRSIVVQMRRWVAENSWKSTCTISEVREERLQGRNDGKMSVAGYIWGPVLNNCEWIKSSAHQDMDIYGCESLLKCDGLKPSS